MIENYKRLNYNVLIKMNGQYFPPYGSSSNIKVQLDLTNYATKDDVKNITHIDVSGYATKTNLAALKTEVDKIDTDKLKTVPADLAKLTSVVKMKLLKRLILVLMIESVELENKITSNTAKINNSTTKVNAIDAKITIVKADLNNYAKKVTFLMILLQ